MKVAILLPTANRPGMLATALGSIARQSALDRVERIVVSENGGNRASESVCRQFPGLPIHYVFRDPPVKAVEHGRRLLWQEAKTPFLAMLCDDDWWAPGHLAGALDALTLHPAAVACGSACLTVRSETDSAGRIQIAVATRTAAGNPGCTSLWRLSPTQLLAAALLQTPFHLSALVAQGPALQQAYEFATSASHWSVDRLMIAALALSGEVVFDPLVSIYVRLHGGNDMNRFSKAARRAVQPEARRGVEEIARKLGIDLGAFWRAALEKAPSELRGSLFDNINYALRFHGAVQYGVASFFFDHALAWHAYRVVRKWRNLRCAP